VVPPQSVIATFDCVAQALLQRNHHSSVENAALADLRDRLLPKLLSGEVRVRDAEKVVEAVA
jgi:type I restriction enzyme, S subunit